MAQFIILDDAIWSKHLSDQLRSKVNDLEPGERILLEVDGITGWWERMKNGADGRPTFGIKPVNAMKDVWQLWKSRRGQSIEIRLPATADSYLKSLEGSMDEWASSDDEAAYADL